MSRVLKVELSLDSNEMCELSQYDERYEAWVNFELRANLERIVEAAIHGGPRPLYDGLGNRVGSAWVTSETRHRSWDTINS